MQIQFVSPQIAWQFDFDIGGASIFEMRGRFGLFYDFIGDLFDTFWGLN